MPTAETQVVYDVHQKVLDYINSADWTLKASRGLVITAPYDKRASKKVVFVLTFDGNWMDSEEWRAIAEDVLIARGCTDDDLLDVSILGDTDKETGKFSIYVGLPLALAHKILDVPLTRRLLN